MVIKHIILNSFCKEECFTKLFWAWSILQYKH